MPLQAAESEAGQQQVNDGLSVPVAHGLSTFELDATLQHHCLCMPAITPTTTQRFPRIKTLPDGLFGSCINLAALLLRSNPITVEALRTAPDFQQYEERRRARTNKQLGGRVMSDIERGFCEGADVGLWEHYKK